MEAEDIKNFYKEYHDDIFNKRYDSPYPLRRHLHRTQLNLILNLVPSESKKVLDAGCGEGILAVLLAKKGILVTACDISIPNLEQAKKRAADKGVLDKINFLEADVENLPFQDNEFDLVISSHVLEHLPNFEKGLSEIKRVTKKRAIIALPTCLNLCALSLLGGAEYWYVRKKSFLAIPIGIMRFIFNIFGKGVNEGYVGKKDLPHLRRYPWAMKKELKKAGFKIVKFEANTICLPYFNFFLPLIKWLDKYAQSPILRNFGYGSIAVVEKVEK
jgi:ubiquinone/menaquinone biosynthesis C-methylase UbiE